MNLVQDLINGLQELVAQVPEFIQPFILALAGAIPAVEGDVAAVMGIISGINPVVAAVAGATGNFLSVFLVVVLTSRARTAVVKRARNRAVVAVGAAGRGAFEDEDRAAAFDAATSAKPDSKGRQRFKKWFVRYGVPGASLLGPLALPSQVTSAILVAGGSPRTWVLLWHAISIIAWTAVATVSAWLALMLVFAV
ncbi:MAG TPA: small multidrug efflux protein [Protaetiibacter sp.]|jgi:hypothetical protein|nr:small multidrug efflux protein [Protaetiibacter sp.]